MGHALASDYAEMQVLMKGDVVSKQVGAGSAKARPR